jgi:GNAT superfamily N-acetyltransferase
VPEPLTDVRALTQDRFGDVVDLFGTRGDPSWCWCQYFLTTGSGYTSSAPDNREALRRQAGGASPPGLLAFEDGQPVGWVQVGPRRDFPRVVTNRRVLAASGVPALDASVWAVTCFVVRVGHRRHGWSARLLAAAVRAAHEAGARSVEGYPVDVSARTTRVAGAELYHGALSTFLAAGFREVGRTGTTRPVVRLDLR